MIDAPASSAQLLDRFHQQLDELSETWIQDYLYVLIDSYRQFGQAIERVMQGNFAKMDVAFESGNKRGLRQLSFQTLEDLEQLLAEFHASQLNIIREYIQVGTNNWLVGIDQLIEAQPEKIPQEYTADQLTPTPLDNLRQRRIKSYHRFRKNMLGQPPRIQLNFRFLLEEDIRAVYFQNVIAYCQAICLASHDIVDQYGQGIQQSLLAYQSQEEKGSEISHRVLIEQYLSPVQKFLDAQVPAWLDYLKEFNQLFIQRLKLEVVNPDINREMRTQGQKGLQARNMLRNFAEVWDHNQQYYHRAFETDIKLLKVNTHLNRLADDLKASLTQQYVSPSRTHLELAQKKLDRLGKMLEKESLVGIEKLHLEEEVEPGFGEENIAEETATSLRFILEQLPENTELFDPGSLKEVGAGNRLALEAQPVALSSLTTFLIRRNFIAPVEDLLKGTPDQFKKIFYQIQSAIRLLAFSVQPEEAQPNAKEPDFQKIKKVWQKTYKQIQDAEAKLDDLTESLSESVNAYVQQTRQALSARTLMEQADRLESNMRGVERLAGLRWLTDRVRTQARKTWTQANNLLGRTRSELVRSGFENSQKADLNLYARVYNFVYQVSPRQEVIRLLPFYYTQLFVGKQSVGLAGLTFRQTEIQQAEQGIDRMKSRVGGGLLVLGEAMSGKTVFSEYLANEHFSGKLYRIHPPTQGSSSAQVLKQAFEKAVQGRGTLDQLVDSVPPGSVFLINDLELWWKRREKGTEVIQRLNRLIAKYSQDYYFIVNANPFAYGLICELSDINQQFISTVQLGPLSAEELQETIMNRHYSGGLQLKWAGKNQDEISPARLGRLFRRYLLISRGNVGYALRLWLSNITAVNQQEIEIQEPQVLELPDFRRLDWLVMLAQFVLHKHLTLDQLRRVYIQEPAGSVQALLADLKKAGLIEEVNRQTYGINPYVYPYLVKRLRAYHLI
ncbi:MAG: hypothetical protein AAFR61_22355 [Bacteroidota bacterium]